MNPRATAHIFPAFVPEFRGNETDTILRLHPAAAAMFEDAAALTAYKVSELKVSDKAVPADELLAQYITYIHSCAISDILRARTAPPALCAAYSMGLYAMLYHAGCIDFGTGLQLIKEAFLQMRAVLPAGRYGMAVIGGLNRSDVQKIIDEAGGGCSLINVNSSHSVVISGSLAATERCVAVAVAEGALHTRVLGVSLPYHSSMLQPVRESFRKSLEGVQIREAAYPLFSAVSGSFFRSLDEIREELTANLYTGMDWYGCFRAMLSQGIGCFVEAGAGESMQKIAKFIEGDFEIITSRRLETYLNNYEQTTQS